MTILVLNTVAHFYTVAHLTALTALKQMDAEFEMVSSSLKQPYRTFALVTVPVCLPAILDIAIYLYVNAMTTVSGVVFLRGPNTELASISVLNMDDPGEIASAAARGVHVVLARVLERRTQPGAGGGARAAPRACSAAVTSLTWSRAGASVTTWRPGRLDRGISWACGSSGLA